MEPTNTDDTQKTAEQFFSQLAYAKLQKQVVQDLINNRKESVIFKRYPIERVVSMLEAPQSYEKQLREMSNFLFIVSSHYRRLVLYYANLPTFDYMVVPQNNVTKKVNTKTYKNAYANVVSQFAKYNLKTEAPKILQTVLLEGVFYGLVYETTDSYYIKPFNSEFADITSVEDGCCVFSMDLNYFIGKEYLLPQYGEEITNAFWRYKGNSKLGIKSNSKLRYHEPTNGICIKADVSNPLFSVPVFCSTFMEVLDLEDYRMLKKASKTLDNYKVLAMKMECDENGVPKMDFGMAMKYYNQASANLPDGIGLIISPFTMQEFSFNKSATADSDALNEAVNSFWEASGTNGMLFGSTKASSSSSLSLSTKPDEQLSFGILSQIEKYFNKQIKQMNLPYLFQMKFLDESIFNADEVSNRMFKGGQYGVSGAKLHYAASIGMTPSEVLNLAYLENEILNVSEDMFTDPLISSNTMSPDSVATEGGAPTVEEQGGTATDNTEKSREQNGNNEN